MIAQRQSNLCGIAIRHDIFPVQRKGRPGNWIVLQYAKRLYLQVQDETGDMRMHISIIMQQVTFFMTYSSLLRNAFIIPFCFLLSRGECIKNSQETADAFACLDFFPFPY